MPKIRDVPWSRAAFTPLPQNGNRMRPTLTMFDAFGKNTQCQNFGARHRLVTARPVSEYAR